MSKKISFIHPVNGLTILDISPTFINSFATEDDAIAACAEKDVPLGATQLAVIEVADDFMEKNVRWFYGAEHPAWKIVGGKLTVNMAEARKQRMHEIRYGQKRKDLFTELDHQYSRADGQGNQTEKDAAEATRQELRDMPATIQPDVDAAKTPGDLATVEPTWPVLS